MKKFVAFLLLTSNLIALEFGQIGNTPASVGGAGVAYRKNAWAVYYNPAILGANRQASIAYSFGVGYADSNVLELASIDVNALKNIQDEMNGLTKTQAGGGNQPVVTFSLKNGVAPQANGTDWNLEQLGLLGEVFGNLTGKGGNGQTLTSKDLGDYLCGKANGGTTTNNGDCNLNNVKDKLNDKQEVLTTIKNELQDAIKKTAESHPNNTALDILGDIVSSIDPSNIPDLVESVKGGKAELKTILQKVGGVKISKGTSPALDSLFTIVDTINKNGLTISSNNGIAWHIKGNKDRGAIGMGILANIYGFAGVELDSTHKRIIIKNNDDYFEVGVSGDKITLSSSDSGAYNNNSVLSSSANHKLHANGVAITEIPIAYGHTIPMPLGDLHLGATLKYIFAASMDNSQKFDFDNLKINFGNVRDNLRYTHTFGVDLGALWTMKWLGLGIVAKNLNAPLIKTANGKYRILPQVRAGFSAEVWKLTFLADIDLTPNDTLEPGKKNQMVGGGMILDLRWVDFRFGVMGDMHKNPYGPIFTAGINIVHFLDFTIQTSTKMIDISGVSDKVGNIKRMPNYFKVSFGGRFQW